MDSIQIADFLKDIALSNGWKLPSDDVLRPKISAMKKRQNAGRIICPCKGFIDQYTTPESFCPCPEAPEDIKKNGSCHCGVFLEGDE